MRPLVGLSVVMNVLSSTSSAFLRGGMAVRLGVPKIASKPRRLLLRPIRGGSAAAMSMSSTTTTTTTTPTTPMNTAAPAVKLEFASVEAATLKAAESLIVVGRPESLAAATGAFVDAALLEVMVGKGKVGDAGKVANSWAPPAVDGGKMRHLSIAMVPSKASRHNTPARPDAVTALLASALGAGSNGKGDLQVVVVRRLAAAALEPRSLLRSARCAGSLLCRA